MKIGRPGFEIEIDVFGDTDPKRMASFMLIGASNINFASAVKADVSKQASATCPRYWYVTATFECRDCKQPFKFSVEEQRFWYEERKFFPSVLPIRCAPCRKRERQRKLDEQKPKKKKA
jgi:hypothetical protein